MKARHAVIGALLGAACGNTSGPVLDPIAAPVPPDVTQRVEVYLLNEVNSCVIGRACSSSEASRCFYIRAPNGSLSLFEPSSIEFVSADDARIASAEQAGCFRLAHDAVSRANTRSAFTDLRANVFRLSQGRIDLDLRFHEITPTESVFKRWEGGAGLFLQPATLEAQGLALADRDTDYVFAVTGEADPEHGPLPRLDPCAGTNWQVQGGFAGAAYTWSSTSCLTQAQLIWHFLFQSYFAARDCSGNEDIYAAGYPSCGAGDPSTHRWFPRPTDCSRDPDAQNCGRSTCLLDQFATHVFAAHWPSAPGLIGNHCRNGRLDFDETAPDEGGVCDQLGR